MKTFWMSAGLAVSLGFGAAWSQAADLVRQTHIGLELARDLAHQAVVSCRKQGYHVSAVVVDRAGVLRVALRDDLASRFTLQIAEEKANAVILSGVDSARFRAARGDIRGEMNHVEGILMLEGGLPIEAGGVRLGAIGVSGAPGGEKDAACAAEALQALSERLEFIE